MKKLPFVVSGPLLLPSLLAAREAQHPELLQFEGGEFGGAWIILGLAALAVLMIGLLAED